MRVILLIILLSACSTDTDDGRYSVTVTWDNAYEREDGTSMYPYELGDCEIEMEMIIARSNDLNSWFKTIPCEDEVLVIENINSYFVESVKLRIRASDTDGVTSRWSEWATL